jgi:hypothetical protein
VSTPPRSVPTFSESGMYGRTLDTSATATWTATSFPWQETDRGKSSSSCCSRWISSGLSMLSGSHTCRKLVRHGSSSMTIDDAINEGFDDEEVEAATCRTLATPPPVLLTANPDGSTPSTDSAAVEDSLRIPAGRGGSVSFVDADAWTLALETPASASQANRARAGRGRQRRRRRRRPTIVVMVGLEMTLGGIENGVKLESDFCGFAIIGREARRRAFRRTTQVVTVHKRVTRDTTENSDTW